MTCTCNVIGMGVFGVVYGYGVVGMAVSGVVYG